MNDFHQSLSRARAELAVALLVFFFEHQNHNPSLQNSKYSKSLLLFDYQITMTKSNEAIYDRLYKTKTVSSKTRKTYGKTITKCVLAREDQVEKQVVTKQPRRKSVRSRRPKSTRDASRGPVHDRLYRQGSLSSSTRNTLKKKEISSSIDKRRRVLKPMNI